MFTLQLFFIDPRKQLLKLELALRGMLMGRNAKSGIAEYITVIFTILLVMVSVSIGLGFWTQQITTTQKEVAIQSGRADIFNFERIVSAKLRGNSSGIYIPTMTDGRLVFNHSDAVLTVRDVSSGSDPLYNETLRLFVASYEWGRPIFPSTDGTGTAVGGYLMGIGNVSDILEGSINIVESGQGPHYTIFLYYSPTVVPSFTAGTDPDDKVDHFWIYLVRYGDIVPVFATGGNNVVVSVGTREDTTLEFGPNLTPTNPLPNCASSTCTISVSFSIPNTSGYDWSQTYDTTSDHLVLHITHITVQRI